MQTFNFGDIDPTYAPPAAVSVDGGTSPQLVVRFHNQPVENRGKSKEAGRPIFDSEIYIQKFFPGGTDIIDRPATEEEFAQYPAQYEHFLKTNGKGSLIQGTPLQEVPFLSASKVLELQAVKIYTLEQLSGLSDGIIDKLGFGMRELVEKARAFVSLAKGTAESTKQAQDLIETRRELAEAREEIADLRRTVDGLLAVSKDKKPTKTKRVSEDGED